MKRNIVLAVSAGIFAVGIGMVISYLDLRHGDVAPISVPVEVPVQVSAPADVTPVFTQSEQSTIASTVQTADDAVSSSDNGIIRFSFNTGFSDKLGPKAKPGQMIPVTTGSNQ